MMMVCDDQIDTRIPGRCCRAGGGDAAVHGDDHIRVLRGEAGDGVSVQPVSLVESMGDIRGDPGLSIEVTQHVKENRAGGHAVDVVVAVDDDRLTLIQCVEEASGGVVSAWKQGGIMHQPHPRIQKDIRVARLDGAGGQEAADQRLTARITVGRGIRACSGFVNHPAVRQTSHG